jgi:hypothetical protein
MRVLIDEDTAVQLLGLLAHVLPRHQVDHITQINWAGRRTASSWRTRGAPDTT